MAYVKTNWVDNTTPIDKTNLNKIEQGIYDNSLVVDAVTNTLNPTDTETYKTAELTEGQITDVIGVNDIVIKGDTEQDGTPTPSTPIAVNVVSGSNVVNTSNKNLFDKNTEIKGKLIVTTTGGIQDNSAWNISQFIPVKSGTELCFSYQTQGKGQIELVEYDKNQNILGGEAPSITQKYTKTISNNTKFVRVGYRNDLICDNLQLEYGNNRTTYEAHQGKELPLDLGSIELCKTGDYQDYFYKSGNDWYLHKEIAKVVLDGLNYKCSFMFTNGSFVVYDTNNNQTLRNAVKTISNINIISNYLISKTYVEVFNNGNIGVSSSFKLGELVVNIGVTSSKEDINSWFSTHNTSLYYPLETPTDTEITDTTLISQLEAIYNAPLYEQTNITQTNNDLPMVLDITACKDNIKGIKAFIRK